MDENNKKVVETIEKEEYELSDTDKRFLRGAYGRNEKSNVGKICDNWRKSQKVGLIQKVKRFFAKFVK